METLFCSFPHDKQHCTLGVQPALWRTGLYGNFSVNSILNDSVSALEITYVTQQMIKLLFSEATKFLLILNHSENNIDLQLTLHYLTSKGDFWSLPLRIFYFTGQNYVNRKVLIAVLLMCLGTMKGPCFYFHVTVTSVWKNRKSYQDEKLCSKGTQPLQVYKLLDFKRHERKPFGPEVDMSFCSPQPDLPQTLAQTQKTLCSKWLFYLQAGNPIIFLNDTSATFHSCQEGNLWILWSSKPVMFFTVTLRGCPLLGPCQLQINFYYLAPRKLSRSYGFV